MIIYPIWRRGDLYHAVEKLAEKTAHSYSISGPGTLVFQFQASVYAIVDWLLQVPGQQNLIPIRPAGDLETAMRKLPKS